jgi:dTDP-4-amino-4,6-dideoxygalactose transaminase
MSGLIPVENWRYSVRDIFRGLSAALGPSSVNGMFEIPGLGSCIPARSARSGIVAALKALSLQPHARIGVPLYCCPVVFKAIKQAGCTARFIDIEFGTACMSAEDLYKKRSEIDAVIAVHMFGHLCDMPALKEAAGGMPIIEDCAQSLGSRLDGRMAGSFGDIAVFSFRSGKYLSVGEGGALYAGNKDIRTRLAQLIAEMPVPVCSDECVHVVKTFMRSKLRSVPLFGIIGYPLWSLYNKKVSYASKSPLVLSQMYRSDHALTLHRLPFIEAEIKQQRANAHYFTRELQLPADMLCHEKQGAYYNRFMFPVTFASSEQRDFMADFMLGQKIDTSKPYKDSAMVAAEYYGYTGDCPSAEEFGRRVLVIPGNCSLSQEDVHNIARCFNAGWTEITGSSRNPRR